MAEPLDVKASLAAMIDRMVHDQRERDALIVSAAKAGVPKTELVQLTGLARQTIYDILAREAKRECDADLAATEVPWRIGQVIEDRWGLRWIGDVQVPAGTAGWRCRSVGLRVWRTGTQMAERGPLKAIRLDPFFTLDKEKQAQRAVGQAEDEAVIIEPHEDPALSDVSP